MDRPLRPGAILAAAVVLPALLFAVLRQHDMGHRRDALRDEGVVATQLAGEQAQRLIDGGILALDRAEDAIAGLSWVQIQARRASVQADLRRIEAAQPAILGLLALIRPDGRVAAAGGPDQAPNADASGFEAMRAAREAGRSVYFEAASRELAAQGAGLVIGRGRAAEGRPFDGLILSVLRAEAFFTAWSQAGHRPGGRFALVRNDGTILMRQGATAATPALLNASDPLRQAMLADRPQSAPLATDSFGDGEIQYVAWRRIGTLPLSIVYTIPGLPEQRMASLSLALNGIGCFMAGLLLALFAFSGGRRARRDRETLKRLEANASDLRAEIARREAAEDGLRNAQRMEGLGRLTGGVAHDFNNLLTAILGTARALERHLGSRADERTRRLLGATVAAVDRGARLNASLLAFARRQPLVLASVDANLLVQDFRPLLRRALDESVTLDLTLDKKLPPCRADAAQLEAALLNLVINARDAMPRGGTIRIVSRRAWLQEQALAGNPEAQPGPYVAIEVRDTGEGMPPEVRERAFEPFFTTKKDGQGTGLGLSQVFGFMRQIGGHVAIQSTPRRGTTVTLYLPLGSESDGAPGRTASPTLAAPVSGKGVSVLVVEDEPAVRGVAVEMLTDAGFSVLAAPDGPTALQLLREGVPADIIFSDVVMPGGMSGVDLAREARTLRPGVGVLLASGYAAEALAKHGGAGEFDLIGKPYDMDTVLGRIAALAQRRAPEAEAKESEPAVLASPR
ncbi:ATP-binding protein [Roseomonas sp. CAU 1739]|uniref:ATP-binding protein n=1 Tax=Roseomonas sp. CAU 1739 TaxID=3140364 RepID=UPI00325C28C9